MDFVYAPPPPPPAKSSSSNNNNGSNNRSNLDKRNSNVRSRFNNDLGSEGKSSTVLQDLNDLGDLPTYLPNSSSYSNEVVDKEDNENEDDDIVHEETESQNKSNEPVFITGTNITLETEEDIKKWIEERKKKWPSKRNIEEKEKIRQEQNNRNANSKKRNNESNVSQNTKQPKNICKFYQNNKRCKFGNKCKNVHEDVTSRGAKSSQNIKTINNIPVVIPQRFKNELYINEKDTNAHTLLFKMLVQKEHFENENSKVLEFLEFLNEAGLIDHDVTI